MWMYVDISVASPSYLLLMISSYGYGWHCCCYWYYVFLSHSIMHIIVYRIRARGRNVPPGASGAVSGPQARTVPSTPGDESMMRTWSDSGQVVWYLYVLQEHINIVQGGYGGTANDGAQIHV